MAIRLTFDLSIVTLASSMWRLHLSPAVAASFVAFVNAMRAVIYFVTSLFVRPCVRNVRRRFSGRISVHCANCHKSEYEAKLCKRHCTVYKASTICRLLHALDTCCCIGYPCPSRCHGSDQPPKWPKLCLVGS